MVAPSKIQVPAYVNTVAEYLPGPSGSPVSLVHSELRPFQRARTGALRALELGHLPPPPSPGTARATLTRG